MSMKRNYSKKLSKTIALAVMAMSVAGFASVASAEKVANINTTDVNEFLNMDQTKGDTLLPGTGVIVTNKEGVSTIAGVKMDFDAIPNSVTLKTDKDVSINGYGIVAQASNSDDPIGVNYEGGKLTINTGLASPVSWNWQVATAGGIYAAGSDGADVNVDIKAKGLDIIKGEVSENDPVRTYDTEGDPNSHYNIQATARVAEAGIETNMNYGAAANVNINIDLQGEDMNITNMGSGIGVHRSVSNVNVINAKNINIITSTPEQKAMLDVGYDSSKEGYFQSTGIGTTGGVTNIQADKDIKISNYSWGLYGKVTESSSKDAEAILKIDAGGDVTLEGSGFNSKSEAALNNYENRFASVGIWADRVNKALENNNAVSVTSGGTINVTNYEAGIVNTGTNLKLVAEEDINIAALGKYGIMQGKYYDNATRMDSTAGNTEIISHNGNVNISGSEYGIYVANGSNGGTGKVTYNIEGKKINISGGKQGFTANLTNGNVFEYKFKGDTVIKSEDAQGTAIYAMGTDLASGKYNDIDFQDNLEAIGGQNGINIVRSKLNVAKDLKVTTTAQGTGLNLGYGSNASIGNNVDINSGVGAFLTYGSKLNIDGDLTVDASIYGLNFTYARDAVELGVKGKIDINSKSVGMNFNYSDFNLNVKSSLNVEAPKAIVAKGYTGSKQWKSPTLATWDEKWKNDKEGFREYCENIYDTKSWQGNNLLLDTLPLYYITFDEYYEACVAEGTLCPNIGKNGTKTMKDDKSNMSLNVADYTVSVSAASNIVIDLKDASNSSVIKGDLVALDGGKINILNAKNLNFEGKTVLTKQEGNSEINLDLSEGSVWTVTGDSKLTKLSGKDGVIKPGEFTVTTKAAAEGTSVNVVGESGELNDVAGKLFYTNYVTGENNLSAKAVIEGEAARESANMLFKEDNGQGYINTQEATDTEIFGEYNESINKNTNVTVTETGVWAPTGENAVPSLKGEAGSAINMSSADSLNVENYSGETTMLYGHDESDPTQIKGGDVTIGKAEEGSKVTMSTDNKGINTEDNAQVAAVMNAMAQKLTYAEAAETADNTPVNNLSGKVQIAEGLTASSTSIAAGDIKFDKEGKGSVDESTIENKAQKGDTETATMKAVKGALVDGVLMMRAESNDLLKRMGDVRLAEEERGLWAKYYGGKYEMDKANAHVSYKAYQLGYDTKAGKNWTVGGAVSYNEGKDGKTELKNTAVGVYGTWADDKGQYIDLITKIGWLKNDFDVKAAGYQIADTMKNTGMSMSAEYGKRFENKAGSFLEPNAELTFGHINGKNVNAKVVGGGTTLGVDQDAFNSLVGRLGLRIGHKNAKSSVYAKVAMAHEFAGDFDVTFSAPSEPTKKVSVELKDTWGEFQIGGTTKLGKAGLLYANYQRSFAGDVKEKYRVDAGLRWSF